VTRDEAITHYRLTRTGIQRVLKAAVATCTAADLKRAAKQLGVWANDRIEVEDETAIDMVMDLALFEPNQRGKRAFDRFLASRAPEFGADHLDLARRMASARFSIFRVTGRHELAGVWVQDLLGRNEPTWIFDEGLEGSAPDGLEFGMRVFDAGQFHAGFGIVVPADEEMTYFCAEAVSRGNRPAVRHSLAAAFYADAIWANLTGSAEPDLIEAILENRRPPPATWP
jgi:hypothetical protein